MYLQFWWLFQWEVLQWKINLSTLSLNKYLFSSCSSRLRYVAISSSSFILVFRRISCSWSCFSIPLLTSSSSFSKHSISASKFCSCMWYCCSVARNERSKPFSCLESIRVKMLHVLFINNWCIFTSVLLIIFIRSSSKASKIILLLINFPVKSVII